MKLIRIAILLAAFSLAGCTAKKVVARKCEQAAQSDVWVCDPL